MTSIYPGSTEVLTADNHQDESHHSSSKAPVVALLPWGDLFEDFFDTIGVDFETFRKEHMGSYMFGYILALQQVDIQTVLFFVSERVTTPLHFTHIPTGAQVCIVPASGIYRIYRKLRRTALNASGVSEKQKFSDVYQNNTIKTSLLSSLKDTVKSIGSYLSIPWRSLSKEMHQAGCNLILCQEYEHARFDICVLLSKFIKLPVFATFQGGDSPESWLERIFRPLALHQSAGVIVATQTEIQRVQSEYHLPDEKIARIFNPIDLSVWQAGDRTSARHSLGIPEDARVVVCHGRIEIERKGLDVLLQAWAKLWQRHPEWNLRLLLIGTGSDANKFQQMLDTMELQGITWVNEFVRDRTVIQHYLSAADLYTLPSRHEGFPVAPLEAMACNLPVVAADAPGVSDIFEHQEKSGGLVVPRGDSEALAIAIEKVLSNDELRDQMSKAARQRVEDCFSMEVIGQQLRKFFSINSPKPIIEHK